MEFSLKSESLCCLLKLSLMSAIRLVSKILTAQVGVHKQYSMSEKHTGTYVGFSKGDRLILRMMLLARSSQGGSIIIKRPYCI